MTNTKLFMKILLSASALSVFSAGSAYAQVKTVAGTNVQNTFTLDYKVGGLDQIQIDTSATPTEFTVDRLIDLTVASQGDKITLPGAADVELVYSLTNNGNDTQNYALSVIEETTSPDTFDTNAPASAVQALTYYIDDGDGLFQPGGADNAPITYAAATPPTLAPDAVLWIVVTQDIPLTAGDSDQAQVSVVAGALNTGTTTAVTADSDGNTLTGAAENVLADGTSTGNEVANDGKDSATGTYIIESADIEATKAVTVHSEDGTTCATIPGTAIGGYSVPGACVEYVITVENSGTASATGIAVSDTLPNALTFMSAAYGGDFTGGSLATPTASTDCAGSACTVALTAATLPAPVSPAVLTTGTVTIRALVK